MLSRVANSVYWMFRYLERAQNISRFINSDFNVFLDNKKNQGNLWASLVAITGDEEFYIEKYKEYTRERIIHFMTLDTEYSNSIIQCITKARENARSVREIISSEMWEEINSLYLMIKSYRSSEGVIVDPFEFCKSVLASCYQFVGLYYSTMNRVEAWHFGRLGMFLETADKTSRILDVKYFILLPDPTWVGTAYDNTQWAALLKSVSGLEMYRKLYKKIDPINVAEFLIFNRLFPRSLFHCIQECCESIKIISQASSGSILNEAHKSLLRLTTDLETSTIGEVVKTGLHDYIDSIQDRMNIIDGNIFKSFFAQKLVTENYELIGAGQSQ